MFEVKFADIGEGLTEGKVTEILVKIGDQVKMGDSLFHVETDKVNSEIPTPVAGTIAKILVKPDEEIKVGQVVFVIDDGSTSSPVKEENKSEAKSEPVEENASVVGSTPVSNDVLPSRAPEAQKPSQPTIQKSSVKYDTKEDFDVIVVGAGIGGYVSAIKVAQLGLKAMIVEKQYYGGVCLNVGCIPTKALLKAAKAFDIALNKNDVFGISYPGNVKPSLDWKKVQSRKDDIVGKLTGGVRYLLDKNKVKRIEGKAQALDPNTVEVDGIKYGCKNLIIATGSVPNSLPLPGFAEAAKSGYLINSTGALSLPTIPKKLVIIGGGVIGVEFACLYANVGVEVTILQGLPTILEMLDKDVITEMTKQLKERYKINVITNAKIKEIKDKSVIYELDGKEQKITTDYCLESVGRKTVIDGFENMGLDITDRKAINVDDYCETNIEGVYAIGDVIGKAMLAHVASHAGIVAANRIAMKNGSSKAHDIKMDFAKIPSCIYTSPEVAMIGKTEQQLEKEGVEYKAFKFPFSAIGKALVDDHPYGFVKLIVEPKYKTVLGAHIIGSTATEMISEITTLIECEGTITEVARAIHPHPTMSEAIGEVAEALETGLPINL
ncbi:pyruvate dehydrogenase E3 component [Williamsoniiplasma somnilux]|uniref:Dihydrolipoyl dehydrogenase n=1 Tax=Williamsoniiplasma somnilux TaxID=215578 RepID=A0A2K8NYM8_9MOLU|nr:dihydrolipoyl dehydrogenase [Williamsoniiplasma somnilux]ATZ18930.1 pyruvate dehydrogenase E3 component [Williamsoniiplasma somnilux]